MARHTPQRAELVARTTDNLCRRLKTSQLDVISLSEAAPPLRYRVMRDGRLLLNRDPAALQRFIAESVLDYLDFKPLRDRAFDVMRRAIVEPR